MPGQRSCVLLASAALLVAAVAATDLFTALVKKDLQAFISALGTSDVNAPDDGGRFALIEAAKMSRKDFLEMALEYGAQTSVTEAATGKTALHYAMEKNNAIMSQALLAFGADPNAPDEEGVTPRALAKSKALLAMLALHDAEGAAAFEDAPGSWILGKTEGEGKQYYYHRKRKAAFWRAPPSCAWTAHVQDDGSKLYVNTVTGQAVYNLPRALAWRRVTSGDTVFWANVRTNVSQVEEPAELPPDLREQPPVGDTYWVNSVTGESSWEEPKVSDWIELSEPDGKKYFYNEKTQETSWDAPPELSWREVHDDEQDRKYWFNSRTKESQWTTPPELAWVPVSANDEL